MPPDVQFEQDLCAAGYQRVAGIDEAGRGCWAGPVVAAAVVLSPQVLAQPTLLAGLDDSKLLKVKQRESTYAQVLAHADGVGLGVVPAYLVDALRIVPATRLAMTVALLSLGCPVEALLIDAVKLEEIALPQQALIKGDARCLSIAAASVVAKVTRDRLMRGLAQVYPGYGFAAHKGYGTAAHQRALRQLGPCTLHRKTFRPVAEIVELFT